MPPVTPATRWAPARRLAVWDVCIPEGATSRSHPGTLGLRGARRRLRSRLRGARRSRWPRPRPRPQSAKTASRWTLPACPPPGPARRSSSSRGPGVLDNALPRQAAWDGARWRVRVPLSDQRVDAPARMDAVLVAAGARPPACASASTSPAAGPRPAARAGARLAAPSTAGSAVAPLGLGLGAALRADRRRHPQPDALRLPGALAEGARLRAPRRRPPPTRSAAAPHGWAWCCRSSRWRRCCSRCAPAASSSAGLPAAVAGGDRGAGGAVHADRPEPRRRVRVRLGAAQQPRHAAGQAPGADSFLTGVLAVAVASPCTAPFMGASLGWPSRCRRKGAGGIRRARPGHGAAPSGRQPVAGGGVNAAAAGRVDGALQALMAFPMFATVIWLVWVIGQQVGIDGAAALLAVLLALAFIAWALGTPGIGRIGARGLRRMRRAGLRRGAVVDAARAACAAAATEGGWRAAAAKAARPGSLERTARGRAARGRQAGIRRLHRRLVRDLPVQQAQHAGAPA